jgi:hypothetical protein
MEIPILDFDAFCCDVSVNYFVVGCCTEKSIQYVMVVTVSLFLLPLHKALSAHLLLSTFMVNQLKEVTISGKIMNHISATKEIYNG